MHHDVSAFIYQFHIGQDKHVLVCFYYPPWRYPVFFLIYSVSSTLTEKAMTSHSSTLAWKIPWMEEPGRLQSMGSLRIGPDWATSLWLFTSMHWRRKWQPLQCSCLENPRDSGAWWAAVYGVAQSRTRLNQLCSSMHTMWYYWYFHSHFRIWFPL